MPLSGTTQFAPGGAAEVILKNDSIDSGYRIDALTVRVDGAILGQTIGAKCYDGFIGGGMLITESGNGALDHALGPYFLGPGKVLTIVWEGGIPGQTATAILTGEPQKAGFSGSLSFEIQAPGDLFIPSFFSIAAATPFRHRQSHTAVGDTTSAMDLTLVIPDDKVAFVTAWGYAPNQLVNDIFAMYLQVVEPSGSVTSVGSWGKGVYQSAATIRQIDKVCKLVNTLVLAKVGGEASPPSLRCLSDRTTITGNVTCTTVVTGFLMNLGGPSV